MTRRVALSLRFALAFAPVAALADAGWLDEARHALEESIPQVAAAKVEKLLASPELTREQRDEATFLLVQALHQSGQIEEAVQQLRPLLAKNWPGAALLQARLLARQGDWAEALAAYHELSAAPHPPVEALLGEAECLQALGRLEDALARFQSAAPATGAPPLLRLRIAALYVELHQPQKAEIMLGKLQALSPEEARWKTYLEGRLLLLRDQAAPALTVFEGIINAREEMPESLLVAATFGAAEARTALYGLEKATKVLLVYIGQRPSSPYLPQAFRRLDAMLAQEEDVPEADYKRWSQRPQARRAALARFYLAKLQIRQRKLERAAATLEGFIRSASEHPLIGEAYLLQAEVLSRKGEFTEAAHSLDGAMRHAEDAETRAQIELRSGLIHYEQGEYLLAATQFDAAAKRSPSLRAIATFDAALAWLFQRNFDRFEEEYQLFTTAQPTSPLRPELLLEQGLTLARGGDEKARPALERFRQEFPAHSRGAEALLALAELSVPAEDQPPSPRAREEAGQHLRLISAAAPAAEVEAQAQYLAFWLSDSEEPRSDEKVINLGRTFLAKHAESAWAAAVRMKLGQIYFNREDFANAETYFQQLVQGDPNSPLAEAALFLSGQSAARLMNSGAIDRALASFDAVAQRDGPLKLYARQEQAGIQSRLNHEDQAIALYDLMLSATPPPDAQLRQAAMCEKGDALLSLGRREASNDRLAKAIAAFEELAAQPDVTPVWRNQALYKKGKTLEQLGRNDEATLAYYDVLQRSTVADREYFWLYKAGFDAARLFEQQEQWKSAAGIYTKMAAFNGPRTAEARSRLKQLRLDHYIWE